MDAIIEDLYFNWLYSHIADPEDKSINRTYWNLARQLHQKEFIYNVPNDDNRWLDGRELRNEFRGYWEEEHEYVPPLWTDLSCSMLEMLIALSDRLEFQTDEESQLWFWRLLENIGIADFSDRHYTDEARLLIDAALEKVIWRTYSYSGEGGLFPLEGADRDQRQLEIWFQMHTYLLEGG